MTITTAEAIIASPWADLPRPTTAEQWIRRAEEVAGILEVDAVERDRALVTPHAEVRLLKQAGLVTLLGPTAQGGAGQSWETAYQVIRRVAEGDGSIGQLLGYHYLWSQLPAFFGNPGQGEQIIATATSEGWFFGGAVNPRDADLVAVDTGGDLVFSGHKTFSTGSKVSDVTWLEAAIEGHEEHIFALAPSDHPGITFHDGWDALGQRLTEWQDAGVDGINVVNVTRPGSYEEFIEHVTPVLQERGLQKREYADGTLRRKIFGTDVLPDRHPAAGYRGAFRSDRVSV
jgi:alkylation response protein AidB-like acyl-CoA dehydrogenase